MKTSFPGATNETLLQKFNSVHKDSKFYEKPQKKENAFIIRHYAGKVKYQVRAVDSTLTTPWNHFNALLFFLYN